MIAVIVPTELFDQNRDRFIGQITPHRWAVRSRKLSIGRSRFRRYADEECGTVVARHHELAVFVSTSNDGSTITGPSNSIAYDVV